MQAAWSLRGTPAGAVGRPTADPWPALLLCTTIAFLALAVLLPMGFLLAQSLYDGGGRFVGLANVRAYLDTPALRESAWRSVRLATLSAGICTVLAYGYAYALTRTAMPGKALFRAVALVPLLAPSLLMAISLIYLFGNQGLLKGWMGGASLYGEGGIVAGSVLWTLPHALLILTTALGTSDARLYEAARCLGAGPWRQFTSVTLPGSRYGLAMAFIVVFVLVITDFGVPKVVGGQANVLATDIYKQVVGQQNFQMGAVVALVLLLPAVLAFLAEASLRRRQAAALGVRAVPYEPRPAPWADATAFIYCSVVAGILAIVLGVAVFAALATYWPYDLQPSFKNFDFDNMDGGGWATYGNSLQLATATALIGTAFAFLGAWLVDKAAGLVPGRRALGALATLPLAIPGLALGLGYILFFSAPWNPLQGLYGSLALLVVCTVAHYYSVPHLTLLTALRQLDAEYEHVAASLGVAPLRTALGVHLPVCLPALFDVAGYFFVNAMTTVSAVVFLYSADTPLASVAVLNMDDAGDIAPAAAMAVLIFATAGAARGLLALAGQAVVRRSQAWRRR